MNTTIQAILHDILVNADIDDVERLRVAVATHDPGSNLEALLQDVYLDPDFGLRELND